MFALLGHDATEWNKPTKIDILFVNNYDCNKTLLFCYYLFPMF